MIIKTELQELLERIPANKRKRYSSMLLGQYQRELRNLKLKYKILLGKNPEKLQKLLPKIEIALIRVSYLNAYRNTIR
ncbi:hypothetical protein [Bacillus bombysepticus]|uniref:hypothetical protein n=1 Tax=Bacillus bombysepticus TaxID=658666 RepID=UPI00301710F4